MSKKDAYYFSHDSNARHDPKIIKLRTKHGLEGYGFYFCLLEIMRESADYFIDFDDLETVSFQLNISHEKATEIIKSCIKVKLLKQDQNKLISESFISRMHEVDEMRKRQSENGKKGGKPKATHNPNESQTKAENNPNESIKGKERREKEINKRKEEESQRDLSQNPEYTGNNGGQAVTLSEIKIFMEDELKAILVNRGMSVEEAEQDQHFNYVFDKKADKYFALCKAKSVKNPPAYIATLLQSDFNEFIKRG